MKRLRLLLLLSVVGLPAVAYSGDEPDPGRRPKPVIRAPIMVAGDVSVKATSAAMA